MAPGRAISGRAIANAEAMAVPFKKCLRDAFERESKVGLCMTGKRFIWQQHGLSRHFDVCEQENLSHQAGGNSQKKREVLTEHLPEVITGNET